jgi:hypothetical protein
LTGLFWTQTPSSVRYPAAKPFDTAAILLADSGKPLLAWSAFATIATPRHGQDPYR